MSATGAPPVSAEGRVLAIAAVMASYMQAVNIAIPNAALSYMQGTLSMADDEIGWIFTAYLAATVVIMPTTPWLAGRFGRKMVFQVSLIIFTLGLWLDTLAITPAQFVLARIIQGAASGPFIPLSMTILIEVLTPARRAGIGLAMGASGLLGISSGPGIGGWLSDYHGWPSIFYFSVPMVGFILLAITLLLSEKKAAQPPPFDFFGFTALTMGMIGLQMVLDGGERLEWFVSPMIWVEAIVSVAGFYLFFVHILTKEVHFFNKGLLRNRNFVLSTIIYFAVGFVLLPTLALTSPMLNELLNYPVDTTGYMAIPRGVTLVGVLLLMSFVPARIDNRMLALGGLVIIAYANWRMLGYSPAMDWRAVAIAGFLQGIGLAVSIWALTRTSLSTLDQKLHAEGGAIFNVCRLYGSTLGIAVVQIFFYSNTQAMHTALAKDLAPYRVVAHVTATLAKPELAKLNEMITGQAAVVSILGQFKILFFATVIVIPLVLFLQKPRPLAMAQPRK